MTRLIDADALLAKLYSKSECLSKAETIAHIENAPTVQREGWVSVPFEPTREMLDAGHKDLTRDFGIDSMLKVAYKAMLSAAPVKE